MNPMHTLSAKPDYFNTVHLPADTQVVLPAERGRRDHSPKSYSVRLCQNRECKRILWNRDVNAAINILRLFLDWVEGKQKPDQFRRAVH